MFVNLIALDFLLAAVAGLVNQHQLRVIEYLQEENQILREMRGKKRLRFTDDLSLPKTPSVSFARRDVAGRHHDLGDSPPTIGLRHRQHKRSIPSA